METTMNTNLNPMVDLTGASGNAFKIVTRAVKALCDCGRSEVQIKAFRAEVRADEVMRYPTDETPDELLRHVLKVTGKHCLILGKGRKDI